MSFDQFSVTIRKGSQRSISPMSTLRAKVIGKGNKVQKSNPDYIFCFIVSIDQGHIGQDVKIQGPNDSYFTCLANSHVWAVFCGKCPRSFEF